MYTIKFWHSFHLKKKIASEAADNVAVCKWIFAHIFFLSTTYVSDVAHKTKAYYAFHTFLFVKCYLNNCVNLTREVAVQFPAEKYCFVLKWSFVVSLFR